MENWGWANINLSVRRHDLSGTGETTGSSGQTKKHASFNKLYKLGCENDLRWVRRTVPTVRSCFRATLIASVIMTLRRLVADVAAVIGCVRSSRRAFVRVTHLISSDRISTDHIACEWQWVRRGATRFAVAATDQNVLIGRSHGKLGRFTAHLLHSVQMK